MVRVNDGAIVGMESYDNETGRWHPRKRGEAWFPIFRQAPLPGSSQDLSFTSAGRAIPHGPLA
jgi:hypothetical protein